MLSNEVRPPARATVPVISGAELDHLARDRGVGVIAVGNFSVMAAVLRRAAAMAAQHLERWEIIDYASDDEPDVPSGTARLGP